MSMSTLAFKKAARSRCQPLRRHSYESDVLFKGQWEYSGVERLRLYEGGPGFVLVLNSTPLAPAGIVNAEFVFGPNACALPPVSLKA